MEDGKALRAEMAGVIGRTSVPAIWIGESSPGTFINVLNCIFVLNCVHRIILTLHFLTCRV